MSTEAAVALDLIVAQNLHRLRVARGLPSRLLAEALGVTAQQIRKYEAGSDRISAGRLFLAANYLGVPVDALFHEARDARTSPEHEVAPAFCPSLR